MNEDILNQARQLRETIKALHRRVLFRNVRRASQDKSRQQDLSLAQMTTMMVITDRGPLSLKDIATATEVSRPSASTMVNRLVDLGMVTRQTSQCDRREVRIDTTEEGRTAVESIEKELLESIAELLERIGPEYATRWCDVYTKLQECLNEDNEAAASLDAAS